MSRQWIPRIVAVLLAFLPFAPWVYLHVAPLYDAARYGPELAIDLIALVLFALHPIRIFGRVRALWPFVALLIAIWLFSDLWNDVPMRTAAIGLRSELRYLSLAAIVAAGADPISDLVLYARVVIGSALVQCLIALQSVLGASTLLTTLGDRNQLGVFLAVSIVVFAATGGSGIGLGRRGTAATAVALVIGLFCSASREAAIGAAVGLAIVAAFRFGRRVRLSLAVLAVVAGLVLLLPTLVGYGHSSVDAHGVLQRWRLLFQADLSPNSSFRIRLLVDNTRLVEHHKPLLGYGLGTASDPRVIKNLTSPVYRSFEDYDLAKSIEPYVYDSNWAIVILETGIIGTVALAVVFLQLVALGIRLRGQGWVGVAIAAVVPAVVVMGFAAPTFQEPLVSAPFWILAGATAASGLTAGSRAPISPSFRRRRRHAGEPGVAPLPASR